MPIPDIIFSNAITAFIGFGTGIHGWRRGWSLPRTIVVGLCATWGLNFISLVVENLS